MTDAENLEIVRNAERDRFEVADAPQRAFLEYRQAGDRLVLKHTQVDDELAGEGVGSTLVREALAEAERESLTVVPVCWFVAEWLERHPERASEIDVAVP